MHNCEPLAWYGAIVLLIVGSLVLMPFWYRRAELLSAWNFLLLGIAIFVGIGCFEATMSPMRFHGLESFEPTKNEVMWYIAATTIFLITLIVAHYYDPVSKAVAARCFNKWPPISTSVLFFAMTVCLTLMIMSQIPFLLTIPFIGEALVNISHKTYVFGATFSFLLWYRNRQNLAFLGMFILVFLGTCLMAMLAAGGRRLLLSVLTAPVIVFYYYNARHWKPTKSMIVISFGVLVVFVLNLMYSSIRHFDRTKEHKGRNVAALIEAIEDIRNRPWFETFEHNSMFHFSQQAVHYALVTDHFVRTGVLQPKPLNTFAFIAVYPIPRSLYPGKPVAIGEVITQEIGWSSTNWGVSVSGHAAYEGGLVVAAMFGYFATFLVRLFDDPLRRQPTNPFLIAMLVAAGPHLIAWPRGDLSSMSFEVGECFFFAWGLAVVCRFIYGTNRSPQVTQMAVPGYPNAYRIPTR